MGILTLLTDFGLADGYVAAVKGVVLTHAPNTTFVDITHSVPAGDIEDASFQLAAVAPHFPPKTVHLAVVDPGVGSARRRLVVETANALFVAPDNGLLTPFVDHPTAKVHAIENAAELGILHGTPSRTFEGRDVFAPVAAFLLNGGRVEALGPPFEDPIRLDLPAPFREEARLVGRVAHIDRFGNVISNLPADWLTAGAAFVARLDARETSRRVDCYHDLRAGEVGVLTGSLGTLEFSANGASAAQLWNVQRSTRVEVKFEAKSDATTGSPTRKEEELKSSV